MTMQEFKAWFDGYTEAMRGVPTKAQWTRIKARVNEIDGVAVTERVLIDRYWPQHYYSSYPVLATTRISGARTISFNSASAMLALGQTEYANGAASD